MQIDEIVEQLESIIGTYEILTGNGVNSDIIGIDDIDAIREAIRMIKAIDDIKAETEQHCNITVGSDNEPAMTLHDVFAIIDKHINGKENK